MNSISVSSPRRSARAAGRLVIARLAPCLLCAALTLTAADFVRAQAPGTIDPIFTPVLPNATVYATLYQAGAVSNTVLAGGDLGYLETDLQPTGFEKGTFIDPTYGNPVSRIVFTAVPEQFIGPAQDAASTAQKLPKILVGGLFGQSTTQFASGAPSQNIFRIFTDGTVDTGFVNAVGAGANNYVTSILPLNDAGHTIIVGGLFTSFNLQPRLRLVRLVNSGAIDPTYSTTSAIDDDVQALAEGISPATGKPDGTVLVAGNFNHVGGQAITKLARLFANGTVDTTFKPAFNMRVLAIAVQPTGKIIVGGEFTTVDGKPASRIARLNYDGSLDPSFSAAVAGLPAGESNPVAVYVLKQLTSPASLGKIYVGGNFTQIDGVTRRYLGLVNPNGTVGAFDPGTAIYDKVQSISVQPNGRVIIGETLGPRIGTTYQKSLIRLIGATTTD